MPATVLISDDEPAIRELLKRWLDRTAFSPIEAASAEEALELAMATPDIKVAIVDMQMPGAGGAWLISELRERFPEISVVIATADANLPGIISLQSTVVGYLVKPLARDALIGLLGDGVRRSEWYAAHPRLPLTAVARR